MKLRELVFEDRLIEFSQKQHFSLSLSIILASSYWNINCLIFKFARIILLPSAILILDKLITSTFISLFSPLHPRVQGSLTEQLFESWETLSGFIRRFDNTASLKRCPQSSLIVPRQGSAHPDPQFSGGRISSCRVVRRRRRLNRPPRRLETFLHELLAFIGAEAIGGSCIFALICFDVSSFIVSSFVVLKNRNLRKQLRYIWVGN